MIAPRFRQQTLAAMGGVVVLYALAAVVWFVYAADAWKKASRQYERERQRFEKEERLISERRKWNELYETEKAAMPTFAVGKATDTTWLRTVEGFASTNLVVISQIDHGAEIEAGDVLELPIEVKSWEGSLEALVKFMHTLENTDAGMFDIKEISMKPSAKRGYLKGSVSLTCAYMREKN